MLLFFLLRLVVAKERVDVESRVFSTWRISQSAVASNRNSFSNVSTDTKTLRPKSRGFPKNYGKTQIFVPNVPSFSNSPMFSTLAMKIQETYDIRPLPWASLIAMTGDQGDQTTYFGSVTAVLLKYMWRSEDHWCFPHCKVYIFLFDIYVVQLYTHVLLFVCFLYFSFLMFLASLHIHTWCESEG